jgi:asparagine synthase (glutamine-hydrolysing)
VPRHLIERPKMGFGVPVDSWLRGGLRDWAESLLDERRLASEGLFDPKPIRKAWQAHLEGHRNLQYQLWSVLMFQAWNEVQCAGHATTSREPMAPASARA